MIHELNGMELDNRYRAWSTMDKYTQHDPEVGRSGERHGDELDMSWKGRTGDIRASSMSARRV